MPEKTHGVKGELILSHRWYETASSHYEETDTIRLIPDPEEKEFIILDYFHEQFEAIKNRKDRKTSCYKIKVNELVELIKEHGSKM